MTPFAAVTDGGNIVIALIAASGPAGAAFLGWRQRTRVQKFDLIEFTVGHVTEDNRRLRLTEAEQDTRIDRLEEELKECARSKARQDAEMNTLKARLRTLEDGRDS